MMAHRRRRAVLAGAALGACLLTAAACSSGGSSASSGSGSTAAGGGKLSLTAEDYYTAQPTHGVVGQILNACAAKAGVTITQDSIANPQLMPKVLQQLSAHTLPDLLMIDNPYLQQIAATGALTQLSPSAIDLSGYYPSIVKAGTYQGKVYGAAPGVNSIALIYNKTMLAAAGLKPPTTWAQLKADATKLTTPQHYGFAMSADNDGEGAWTFLPFFWSSGGDFKNLSSPQAVQALQFVTSLVKDGSMSQSVVTWAQSDVNEQFIAGKAAMMINGPWQFPLLNAKAGLDYGVASIPVPTAGATLKVPLGGEVWTVPVTTPAREAAATKVLACVNSQANQLAYAKANGYIPSLESAAQQVAVQSPQLAPFVTEVSTALTRTAEVGTGYPKIQTAIETAMAAAITGQQSAQAAMSQAQAQSGQ
jgi:multiple sugar transport system substrate-binding protein